MFPKQRLRCAVPQSSKSGPSRKKRRTFVLRALAAYLLGVTSRDRRRADWPAARPCRSWRSRSTARPHSPRHLSWPHPSSCIEGTDSSPLKSDIRPVRQPANSSDLKPGTTSSPGRNGGERLCGCALGSDVGRCRDHVRALSDSRQCQVRDVRKLTPGCFLGAFGLAQ